METTGLEKEVCEKSLIKKQKWCFNDKIWKDEFHKNV